MQARSLLAAPHMDPPAQQHQHQHQHQPAPLPSSGQRSGRRPLRRHLPRGVCRRVAWARLRVRRASAPPSPAASRRRVGTAPSRASGWQPEARLPDPPPPTTKFVSGAELEDPDDVI